MPRFHPQVRRDVATAIRRYDSISDALGDDFWAKFEQACRQVESHPERFHFDPSGWRRANLEKFPYHLLFCEELDGVAAYSGSLVKSLRIFFARISLISRWRGTGCDRPVVGL